MRGLRLAGGSCSSDHVTRPFRPVHAQSSARRSSRSAELAPGHLVLLDQCRQVISHCPVLLPQSCILCVHPRHVLPHCLLPRLLLLLQAGVRRRQARLTGRQRPAHTQTDRLGNQPADAGVPLCTAVQQYSIAPRACAKEPKIFSKQVSQPTSQSPLPAGGQPPAPPPARPPAQRAGPAQPAASPAQRQVLPRCLAAQPAPPRAAAGGGGVAVRVGSEEGFLLYVPCCGCTLHLRWCMQHAGALPIWAAACWAVPLPGGAPTHLSLLCPPSQLSLSIAQPQLSRP